MPPASPPRGLGSRPQLRGVAQEEPSRLHHGAQACHPSSRMGDGRSAVEAPGLDYRGEGAPLGGGDREHGLASPSLLSRTSR